MKDEDQLKLIAIFHYVLAGITAFFSLLSILYVVMGIIFIVAPEDMSSSGPPPPPFMGWMFIVMGVLSLVLGEALALLIFLTGRFIARRVHHTFCVVMAGIECVFMPLGTALGVFTIILLVREPVKALFDSNKNASRAWARQEPDTNPH